MSTSEVITRADLLNILNEVLPVVERSDYIVDEGTNNGWRYRKWNSGIYEAWRQSTSTFNMTQKYGTDQYYMADFYTLPSNVTSIENISINRIDGGNGLITTSIYDIDIPNQRFWFFIWNDGASYSASFTMGMQLKGMWK